MVVEFYLRRIDFTVANTLMAFMNPVMFLGFLFFALYFPYMEARAIFSEIGVKEFVLFSISVILYFITFFFFVGLVNGLLSIFNPKMKKGVLGYHKIVITEDELLESTDYNETRHSYKAISKAKILWKYAFVIISSTQGHVIPLRDFSSKDEAKEFIKLIRSKM